MLTNYNLHTNHLDDRMEIQKMLCHPGQILVFPVLKASGLHCSCAAYCAWKSNWGQCPVMQLAIIKIMVWHSLMLKWIKAVILCRKYFEEISFGQPRNWVGPDDPQCSLPTSTSLWVCDKWCSFSVQADCCIPRWWPALWSMLSYSFQ